MHIYLRMMKQIDTAVYYRMLRNVQLRTDTSIVSYTLIQLNPDLVLCGSSTRKV